MADFTSNTSFDINSTSDVTSVTNDTIGDDDVLFPTPGFVGRFFQTATMTLIFVAALIGNALVIVLCLNKPKELKVSRRLVFHLTVLNLSMTVLVIPSVIVSAAAQGWILSNGWCKASGFFRSLFCVCMIFNLVLISIDRFFFVLKPLRYSTSVTARYHGALLGLIWIVGALIALPPLIGWNRIVYHPSRYMCTGDAARSGPSYTLFVFLIGFVAPFLVMVYVYIMIYRAARTLAKRKEARRVSEDLADSYPESGKEEHFGSRPPEEYTPHSGTSKPQSTSSLVGRIFRRQLTKRSLKSGDSDEWEICKVGAIVMTSFVTCWLPYYIVLIVDAVYGFGSTVPMSISYAWWECFATWMALGSCAINPYVYVLRSPVMRRQASKAAHGVFARCRQCCEKDGRAKHRGNSDFRYSLSRLSSRFSSYKERTSRTGSTKC